jgi:hypothetical protein
MPRYIIERQYLLPVYQHLSVEAPDLMTAAKSASRSLANSPKEIA